MVHYGHIKTLLVHNGPLWVITVVKCCYASFTIVANDISIVSALKCTCVPYRYKFLRYINFMVITNSAFPWFDFQGSPGLWKFTDFMAFLIKCVAHVTLSHIISSNVQSRNLHLAMCTMITIYYWGHTERIEKRSGYPQWAANSS